MVDVAQLVRAPVCGTGGRGFKSRHPPHLFSVEVKTGIFNCILAHLSPASVGDLLFRGKRNSSYTDWVRAKQAKEKA